MDEQPTQVEYMVMVRNDVTGEIAARVVWADNKDIAIDRALLNVFRTNGWHVTSSHVLLVSEVP